MWLITSNSRSNEIWLISVEDVTSTNRSCLFQWYRNNWRYRLRVRRVRRSVAVCGSIIGGKYISLGLVEHDCPAFAPSDGSSAHIYHEAVRNDTRFYDTSIELLFLKADISKKQNNSKSQLSNEIGCLLKFT